MLRWVTPDGRRLLLARVLRTFAYGYLSVVLGVYLLINVAYLYAMPFWQISSSNSTAYPEAPSVAARASAFGPHKRHKRDSKNGVSVASLSFKSARNGRYDRNEDAAAGTG